ncbi:energy transducer TonB [Campylobacter sp. FMV-PI01]|uniref:Energy transducer TonB n=1 Tax=Campylobacter portucalensis TaxID=2608384 RepID=A0A6L5WFJ0_9BACT|nr:energy transducer TonB [Campylobacter portucalensis]MSN95810.1 energy transducer TonB [Campylobacter portucalensis]
MNKDTKRLLISLAISISLHTFALGIYYAITNSKDDEINFGDEAMMGGAFSLVFVQIASTQTNTELSARQDLIDKQISDIDSIESNDDMPKIVEDVEAVEENIIDEVVELIEPIPEIDESIVEKKTPLKEPIKEVKKQPKKKKVEKKPIKKPCKDCNVASVKSSASTKASTVVGLNDANIAGGNLASGISGSSGGLNLNGLIYQAILKHKTYPDRAKKMRAEGRVIITFQLRNKNSFEILKIKQSSGIKILDEHALKIIDKAKIDFPSEAIGKSITVPINFNLKE